MWHRRYEHANKFKKKRAKSLRFISKLSHLVMPWKNHLGSTHQIDICPSHAEFSSEDFLWRLSSAEIIADNTFSLFQKYDRILTLLGRGSMKINETLIKQYQIYYFRGDITSSCRLFSDRPLQDLGLIYHRDKIKARMRFEIFNSQKTFVTEADTTYVFCHSENIHVNNFRLNEMDCLEVEKAIHLDIFSTQECRLIFIEIWHIGR
jgi:environmental stress-induced protein Ves